MQYFKEKRILLRAAGQQLRNIISFYTAKLNWMYAPTGACSSYPLQVPVTPFTTVFRLLLLLWLTSGQSLAEMHRDLVVANSVFIPSLAYRSFL